MNVKALALKLVMAKFESQKTDKGELNYEGELAIGTEVFVANEDGEPVAAADGEYTAEDGRVIVVTEGKVSEIREPEPEEEPAEEPAALTAHKAARVAASESYNEIMQKIQEAIGGDAYVIEAGEGWAVADVWDEEDQKERFYRYPVTINEDGSISLGDPEEVFPRFVSADEAANLKFETQEEIYALKEEIDNLRAENEDLKKRLAEKDDLVKELESKLEKPAEEPAVVAASKQEKKKSLLYFETMN